MLLPSSDGKITSTDELSQGKHKEEATLEQTMASDMWLSRCSSPCQETAKCMWRLLTAEL